jgi:hypothetical protein
VRLQARSQKQQELQQTRSVMVKVHVMLIDAPVEQVWEVVHYFDSIAHWHDTIASSKIENHKGSNKVGAVRKFVLQDGAILRELLLAWSNNDHLYRYVFVEGPLTVENRESTLKFTNDGQNKCTAEWFSNDFETPAGQEEVLRAVVEGLYKDGSNGIAQHIVKSA